MRRSDVYYRFCKRLINRYSDLSVYLVKVRYRLIRKIVGYATRAAQYFFRVHYRIYSRLRFRAIRLLVFFMWKRWLRQVEGFDNIPENEGAIIVSNHLSYYDFFILASVLKKQTVFIASSKLQKTSFVRWFMKLDTILYVDVNKPGVSFFKQLYRYLNLNKNIVIYPEGTRSRSGKMLLPKAGFVKLAVMANKPIVPIAMRGTFAILPPHRRLPRFKRCDVVVHKPFRIVPEESRLADIVKKDQTLSIRDRQLIAIRIMDSIRRTTNQDWDESALSAFEVLNNIENSKNWTEAL